MSTDEPPVLPRRKPNVLWWIAAVLMLLLVLFLFQLFGPSPAIVVSPATTYITEPLTPDGLPDYEQYVLRRLRDGVTPQNNAAVEMWQVLGPGEVDRQHWALVAKELGTTIPAANSLLPSIYSKQNRAQILEWLTKNDPAWQPAQQADAAEMAEFGVPVDELDVDDVIGRTHSAPWRSEQLPPLADWARENQTRIDRLVEASRRPRFYFPSPSLLDSSPQGLVSMLLPGIQQTRDIARILSSRAMWHVGEGRHAEAWQDLAAVHRWARLVGQGSLLIDQLVAIAIDGLATQGTIALLADPNLPLPLAEQIHRELAAFPPPARLADTFHGGERLCFLDFVVGAHSQGIGSYLHSMRHWDSLNPGGEFHPLDLVSVDCNVVLAHGNVIFDRLAAACRLSDYQARRKALAAIESEIRQMESRITQPGTIAASVFSPAQRGEFMAATFISLLIGPIDACAQAVDRADAQLDLLRTATALAVYRARHGQYPESLDALVPDVLPQPPQDRFVARPLRYARTAAGFLLYSVGPNGVDDGGSNELLTIFAGRRLPDDADEQARAAFEAQIPAGADDFSLLVPVPPFEISPPPAP